jgi:CRISPR-associated protein Csb2
MTTLSIRFLTGRFHATQWGRHVNEGVPEWPPSPWRILRSLIATWKTKCPDLDDQLAEHVLRKLADLPDFGLPQATASHTRHYMPWDKNYAGHTTLVFDTFVAAPRGSEILVCWPEAHLSEDERIALADWVQSVGYLGRAESWCEMRLLDVEESELRLPEINCRQLGTRSPDKNTEIVRVLCPDPATAFASTHTPRTIVTTGKGKAKQETATAHYDPDWHICGETLWLHAEKWAEAPGSRWVRYSRPTDCFRIVAAQRRANRPVLRPQVIRFALDSAVLPLVTETLAVAESARRNLMGILGGMTERRDGTKGKSEVFSGKSAEGVIRTDHGHAFYLPTDEDGDGRLDHLTLVAQEGFGKDEMAALNSLRQIKSRERTDSGHALGVVLLGSGMLDSEYAQGPTATSFVWRSSTPYLCHRHPKTRGTKKDNEEELASHAVFTEARLREDIRRLLERRDNLKGISLDQIEIAPCVDDNGIFRLGTRGYRPIEFQRFRQKNGDDGGKRLCGAFEITFPLKIRGPIALGHSNHFGMGLFIPYGRPC